MRGYILIDKIVFYQEQKQSRVFIVPFRRYDYLYNDTVNTCPNKLRDFQCKFTIVTMAMKYEQNRINM